MSNKEIKLGINEIKSKYKSQIKFTDTLKCITYKNNCLSILNKFIDLTLL